MKTLLLASACLLVAVSEGNAIEYDPLKHGAEGEAITTCAVLGYDHPQCQTARKCLYKDLAVWATVVHEPDCKDFVAWVHSAEGKRLIESNYNWQKKPPNYETMRQKLRAEMKQVRDENAKQRAEEAANPETVLKAAYKNYIGVKVCYELRKGYEFVWINDAEMYQAKQYAAGIEKALNLPNHEEIWTNSNPEQEAQSIRNLLQISSQTNGLGRGGERWLCQSALQALQHDYNALLKPTFKKDF